MSMEKTRTPEEAIAIIAECLEQEDGEFIAKIYAKVVGVVALYDEDDNSIICGEIKYLGDEVKTFTEEEKKIAVMVINYYGEQCPFATVKSLHGFGRNFLIESVKKAKASNRYTLEFKIVADSLLEKLAGSH